MFRNYVKIAFRNLTKHKLYSIINIGGLSIGIGACLLILLFVLHEHSYDNFVFVLAGAGAIGIAVLTVSWEAVRAAMGNPVKSLKTD